MFSFEDFMKRAESRLLQKPTTTWNRSDDDMNAKARMISVDKPSKPAAVLVPIILHAQPTVLLTERHKDLSQHAGQISFPGGRIDGQETQLQAAIREADEETGIAAHHINAIGYLDCYLTVTNYLVTPVVATVATDFSTKAQASEVTAIFEVPLAFLMDVNNCQTHVREWNGLERRYYVYQHGPHHIWGATAGMIRSLYDTLYS
jgi:8-oxo-dGTP pyrophosphatase MutT (NUDIX family)